MVGRRELGRDREELLRGSGVVEALVQGAYLFTFGV